MATIVEMDLVEVEVGPLRIEVLAVNERDRARQCVAKTLTEATQPGPFFIRVGGATGREQDSDSSVALRQQATEFDYVVGGTNLETLRPPEYNQMYKKDAITTTTTADDHPTTDCHSGMLVFW